MKRKKIWKAAFGMLTAFALAAQPVSTISVVAGESEDYTPILGRDGDPVDLGGIEIVVRNWWEDPTENYITAPRDDYEKAKSELVKWCEKTYNFTVRIEGNEGQSLVKEGEEDAWWDYIPQEYLKYVEDYNAEKQKDSSYDDGKYYVFTLYDDERISSAAAKGYMYDLATLDYLDFSDAVFQGNKVHEQYSVKNHIYAMNAGVSEPRTGVYFNKKVLKDAGIDPDIIYEAQANDTWTWEMFSDLIKKATHLEMDPETGEVDIMSDKNVFGLVADQSSLVIAAVISNGSEFVTLENDEFVNKLKDPKTVKGISYALELIKNENGFYTQNYYSDKAMIADGVFDGPKDSEIPEDVKEAGAEAIDEFCRNYTEMKIGQWEDEHRDFVESLWSYYRNAFAEGNIAFLVDDHYSATPPTSEDSGWNEAFKKGDLGFVMFPKGPSGELVNLWRNNAIVIPGCYDKEKAQKVAFAYYVMNQEPKGFEGYNQYISYSEQGLFDQKSIEETIPAMSHPNYGMVTYDMMVPGLRIGEQFLWDLNGQDDPDNPDAVGTDNYISAVSKQWDEYVYKANNGITAGIKGSPNYIRDKNLSWNDVAGKKYWYEGGYKQGTVEDPKSFTFEGTIRGREIVDPVTNEWYWLDANADGAMADTKEVFMPYVYQDEKDYIDDDEKVKAVAGMSSGKFTDGDKEYEYDFSEQVYKAIKGNGTLEGGKWVRYTAAGDMVKGWYTVEGLDAEVYPDQAGNTYFYDYQTGLMAKGYVTINGEEYHFDELTGALDSTNQE